MDIYILKVYNNTKEMTIVHVHLCAPHYHNRYQRILVLIKVKKKDELKILDLFHYKEEYDIFYLFRFIYLNLYLKIISYTNTKHLHNMPRPKSHGHVNPIVGMLGMCTGCMSTHY